MRPGSRRHGGAPAGRVRRLVAAGLAGMLTVAGAATVSAPAASADSGDDTLTAAMDGAGIDTLNPFLAYYNGAFDTFAMIYPSLTHMNPDGKPAPYLAESWTTSKDKRTWTFTIRDGLKWSDGTPITAEDAAWTLNLIMHDDVAATANGSLVSNFASVKAPDDTTLVIKTKKPQSNMLYVSITRRGIPIVPEHIWKSHVKNLKKFQNEDFPIVGYGPWELTEYKPEQYERFTANENFQLGDHGPPAFEHLLLKSFKNTDAAVSALRSGQIDYARELNPTQYKALEKDDDVTAFQSAGDGWYAIEINSGARTRSGKPIGTANPILADDKVRTAIHYAIDKDKLVSNVIAGLGIPGEGYLTTAYPEWHWAPSGSQAVSYDPDKAKAILDKAGYTMGDDGVRVDPKTGKKLEFRFGIHSQDAQDAQISRYLKGWLAQVGIKVDIESMSFSKLNDNLAKGDWDILMDGWRHGPDPTYLLSIQTCATLPKDNGSGGNTDSFHCNPPYDKLFNKQLTTFDTGKRQQIVKQMQQILYRDNNDIILYYPNGLNAVRTDSVSSLVSGSRNSDGLYPPQKVFWNYLEAEPPAPDQAGGSSNTAWYVGGGIVVVLVIIGGGVALRRRSTADERE